MFRRSPNLRSTAITSLIGSGSHATIRGEARFDGDSGTFELDLDDLARRHDPLEIQLSTGYTATGVLKQGDITIACD